MRIATGKVINGKVVVEGESLEEGAIVTVLAQDDSETFSVSTEDEAALIASIAEIERGESISDAELLERLRHPL